MMDPTPQSDHNTFAIKERQLTHGRELVNEELH